MSVNHAEKDIGAEVHYCLLWYTGFLHTPKKTSGYAYGRIWHSQKSTKVNSYTFNMFIAVKFKFRCHLTYNFSGSW